MPKQKEVLPNEANRCADVTRTTLTLDNDVAAALERLRNARDIGLKELVNDILRRGVRDVAGPPKKHQPFRIRSVALGRVWLNIDNVAEALAIAEEESLK